MHGRPHRGVGGWAARAGETVLPTRADELIVPEVERDTGPREANWRRVVVVMAPRCVGGGRVSCMPIGAGARLAREQRHRRSRPARLAARVHRAGEEERDVGHVGAEVEVVRGVEGPHGDLAVDAAVLGGLVAEATTGGRSGRAADGP